MARTLLLFGFCSLALAQTAVTTSPVSQPAAVDWRFAHPDADMKMSINLQAILNSPAIAKAIEEGKSQAKDKAMQIDLVLAMLRTVDRISVSLRQIAVPQAVRDQGVGAVASTTPDVLAQVTGSFDSQLIAGLFPSTGASKVKVMGPHTLLIGEGDSFARAAERMAGDGVPLSGDELEQSDIWLSASSSFLAQQAGNATNQSMPPALRGLRGLSVGFNLGESPEINLLLTAADDDDAGAMLKTIQTSIGQLAQLNPTASASAKALSLKQDGSRVRMHFVVPPELLAMAQQQAASGAFGQLAPLFGSFGLGGYGPATSAKPPGTIAPPPPPQNDGKIKIYGLDNGPKESPAN